MKRAEKYILWISFLFLSVGFLIFKISNNDIFFHIKAGQWIVEHHRNFTNNIFNYTAGKEKLVNHELLSQLLFYFWYKVFGLGSLIIVKLLVFLGIFYFYFKDNRTVALVTKFIAAIILFFLISERLSIRPELFSMIFAYFLLHYLKKTGRRADAAESGKIAAIAVPAVIALFWVNMHPSFIVGAILISLFIFDALVHRRKATLKIFSLMLVVYLAAAAINPNGLNIYSRMLWEFTQPNYSSAVAEWVSPMALRGIHINATILFFYAYSGIWALLFIFSKKRNLFSVTAFLLFSILAARHRRFIALFALLTIDDFVLFSNRIISKFSFISKILFVVLSGYISFILLTNRFYMFDRRDTRAGFGVNVLSQPVTAASFIEKHLRGAVIFNSFDIGNYLIYKFHPEFQVFISGNFFSSKSMVTYKSIMNFPKSYFPLAEKIFKINTVILKYPNHETVHLIKYLNRRNDWTLAYFDGLAVIYTKSINHSATEGFLKGKKGVYPEDYTNKGYLFSVLHNYARAEFYLNKARILRPNDPVLYNNLANISYIRGEYSVAAKYYRKALALRPNFQEARGNYDALLSKQGVYNSKMKAGRRDIESAEKRKENIE